MAVNRNYFADRCLHCGCLLAPNGDCSWCENNPMSEPHPYPRCSLCGGSVDPDVWGHPHWTCNCGGTKFTKQQMDEWEQSRKNMIEWLGTADWHTKMPQLCSSPGPYGHHFDSSQPLPGLNTCSNCGWQIEFYTADNGALRWREPSQC